MKLLILGGTRFLGRHLGAAALERCLAVTLFNRGTNPNDFADVETILPQLQGFMFINCDKALAAGLRIRPLRDTITDTLEWFQNERANPPLSAGMDAERERTLLRKWHNEYRHST